jgi:tetratricopeptide (TPR) repeat protein
MEKLEKKVRILLKLYQSKSLEKAKKYNTELIRKYPKTVFLYNTMGLILSAKSNLDEAEIYYKKGLKLEPRNFTIYNNLGTLYKLKKNYKKAALNYEKSIELNKNNPEAYNNFGNLQLLMNKYESSILLYKKAIKANKNFYLSDYNLGVVYKSLGNFSESKKYLQRAIKVNKYFFAAHRNLSQIIKYKKGDEHLRLLQSIYKDAKITNNSKVELFYALGKACEDLKDYRNAFKFYKNGNAEYRHKISYSTNNEKKEFMKIKDFFSKELFNNIKEKNPNNFSPIFIVGMPRSGSTLIEQIISNHPDVYGGDELEFLQELVVKHFKLNKDEISFNNKTIQKPNLFKNIGLEYEEKVKILSKNFPTITDKMPVNFKWVGLIKLILPKAKIIHCVRNSKDTCFSIFKNYFTGNELKYAYTLSEIVDYYNLYSDLMRHWEKILPNYIYSVNYQDLISNPISQIKLLIKSCNLIWNKKCLQFYKNTRPIKTASASQARSKIYSTSISIWENYSDELFEEYRNLSN